MGLERRCSAHLLPPREALAPERVPAESRIVKPEALQYRPELFAQEVPIIRWNVTVITDKHEFPAATSTGVSTREFLEQKVSEVHLSVRCCALGLAVIAQIPPIPAPADLRGLRRQIDVGPSETMPGAYPDDLLFGIDPEMSSECTVQPKLPLQIGVLAAIWSLMT